MRWFTDADIDLYVWFKNRRPVCFQLCYKKTQDKDCINWHIKKGFSHPPMKAEKEHIKTRLSARSSALPEFNVTALADEFLRASEQIEIVVADFIFSRLLEFQGLS